MLKVKIKNEVDSGCMQLPPVTSSSGEILIVITFCVSCFPPASLARSFFYEFCAAFSCLVTSCVALIVRKLREQFKTSSEDRTECEPNANK